MVLYLVMKKNYREKLKKKLDDFSCKKVQKIIENIKNVKLYC